MSEADLLRNVQELARTRGWQTAHFGSSVKVVRRGDRYIHVPDADARGFPDLVMIREGRLVVAELKGEKGKVRPEQAIWLALFREAGVDAHIWRPKDWQQIVDVLK